MRTDKTHTKDIDALVFDDKNFNKHTPQGMQMLEQSIQRNGFGRSVFCDRNNVLIGGNGVVETARKLGKTRVRFVETDGDELVVVKRNDIDINTKAGRELALADNATTAVDLDWDEDMLRDVQMDDDIDIDFGEWGLDLPPLDETTDSTPAASSEPESGGVADASASTLMRTHALERKASDGDIWVLGEHRIACVGGDRRTSDALSDLMLDARASMLLMNDGEKSLSHALLSPWLINGSSFYIWTNTERLSGQIERLKDATDFQLLSVLAWVKSEAHVSRKDYASRWQPCLYGCKRGAAHSWYGDKKASDVLTYTLPSDVDGRMYPLPVDMVMYLMDNSSRAGDIVLDPTGNATTLLAADKTHRMAYMCVQGEEAVDGLIDMYINYIARSAEGVYLLKGDGTRVPYADVERKD